MTNSIITALVTGASRNIGRAIALKLAEQGCNVVVHAHTDEAACQEVVAEIEASGGQTTYALADLGNRDEVVALHQKCLDTFGNVDILVCNAAIRPHTDFLEMDEADWHRVMDTNLHSTFLLTRMALPGMIANGWGRIITFAGLQAIRGYQRAAHVSASKHALWGLTKSLAKDYGEKGITSNIISPGPTYAAERENPTKKVTPIGRAGRPEDIAAIVSLLVSEHGAYINGQMMQANGGLET